jgi:hypothetical protein
MLKQIIFFSKKILVTPLSKTTVGFAGVFILIVASLVGGFFLTKSEVPYTSELVFIETSVSPDIEGSVVPASCESNPPTNHFANDCMCSINPITSCSGPSCNRIIKWSASPFTVNIWKDFTNIGLKSGNSQQEFDIPPGGTIFSVRRLDGTVLCSNYVDGYPPPSLSFRVNGASSATVNPSASVTLEWTVGNSAVCTASGAWSGSKAANNGTHSQLVVPASSHSTYTLTCTGPGGTTPAHSVSVTVKPPTVNLTATPSLIGPGSPSTLSWSVSGASFCNASGGWTGPIVPANGNGDQTISPSYSRLTTYRLTCTGIGGTRSDSATIRMPSGIMTATSCVIPYEAGTCQSTVYWNSENFLGARSVKQNGTQFSTSVRSLRSRSVSYGTNVFRLEDTGSSFFLSANALANCQTGSVWVADVQLCIPLPVITLDGEKLIRSGSAADLDITVRANYAATCTISDSAAQTFNHPPAATPRTYSKTSSVLTSAQIITLTCRHSLYPVVTESKQFRVEVLPTVQEI